MMRRILQIQAAALVAILLTGCALLSTDQLNAAKTGMGYGLTFYSGYQKVLAEYALLPYCPVAEGLCKDRETYAKLYALDGAVAQCSQAATATLATNSPDFELVSECVKQVEAAKFAFATAGIKAP